MCASALHVSTVLIAPTCLMSNFLPWRVSICNRRWASRSHLDGLDLYPGLISSIDGAIRECIRCFITNYSRSSTYWVSTASQCISSSEYGRLKLGNSIIYLWIRLWQSFLWYYHKSNVVYHKHGNYYTIVNGEIIDDNEKIKIFYW